MAGDDSDFATLGLNGSGLTRQPWVPRAKWGENYLGQFDADTLWLDATWYAGHVVLVAPRLNNLEKQVRRAEFRLDGRPARARLRRYYRHSLIRLDAPTVPRYVSIQLGDWVGETCVSPSECMDLAGRNALVTVSKNNDLDWIHDWARWHHVHHGADAVVLVDNGSTEYAPDDVEQALRRAGLAQVRVLSTPLPYGPRGQKPYARSEVFLQTGAMNAVRFRCLMQARAVLACDVDELVLCDSGSIFDRAVRSRLGYVAVQGHWVYPSAGHTGPFCHADHQRRHDPPGACPQKWCIVPSGPLRGFQWRMHQVESLPFPSLFRMRDARHLHCAAVTTGWKSNNRFAVPQDTICDEEIAMAMRDAGLKPSDPSA